MESPKTAKTNPALKLLCGSLCRADSFQVREEGRCPRGRNRQEHHGIHRGTGALIQRKLCRDNVGKDHLPAGTGDNLQGLACIRREAEVRQRWMVCRMSPYERRWRGNARRSSARHYSRAGNTMPGQRDSGHLAVPSGIRTLSRVMFRCEDGTNLRANHSIGAYVSQRLNLYWDREGSRATSQGQNRTRESRPSGIEGGSWETWPMEEIGSHAATERAAVVTLHLRSARTQVLPDGRPPRLLLHRRVWFARQQETRPQVVRVHQVGERRSIRRKRYRAVKGDRRLPGRASRSLTIPYDR